jgi:DNA-binding CsgD family transcriptional regulator
MVRILPILGSTLGILIVTVIGERKAEKPSVDLLKAIFSLTPAEARVATLFGSGFRVSQVAERLGVSKETVRSHIKHVFAKIGVSRQSHLARLLATLHL